MPRMRLPNGYGQISQLKNARLRNKYRVRVITSRDSLGNPNYITLGYYRTYGDASQALADYHNDPKPRTQLTLEDLYAEWIKIYPQDNKLSKSRINQFNTTWKHVLIKKAHISDLRPSDLRQEFIRELPRSIPRLMKGLFDLLFDYAVQEQYVEVNISRQVSLPKIVKEKVERGMTAKKAFTEDEIAQVKSEVGKNVAADMLYYSFFSGWRPTEAIELHPVSVNLRMGYVIGGIKTSAGKNRTVPIHPEIEPILRRYMKASKCTLFDISNYTWYVRAFNRLMDQLGIQGHTPHDARRTFVTMAKAAGMNEYALKLIVGHAITDLTESVYTDRPVSWLIDEMNKIPIPCKLTKAAQ